MSSSNDNMEAISDQNDERELPNAKGQTVNDIPAQSQQQPDPEIPTRHARQETQNEQPVHPAGRADVADDTPPETQEKNFIVHNSRLPPPEIVLEQPPFYITVRTVTTRDSKEAVELRSDDLHIVLYMQFYAERWGMKIYPISDSGIISHSLFVFDVSNRSGGCAILVIKIIEQVLGYRKYSTWGNGLMFKRDTAFIEGIPHQKSPV